jgi:hypothetical protein
MYTPLSIRSKYYLYFFIWAQTNNSVMWTLIEGSSVGHETREQNAIFKTATTQQDLGTV